MTRFYFVVHDEWGEAPDNEGAELPDVEAALRHAVRGARCLMSESVRSGELDFTAYIDIEDVDREPVARLTFAEAVKIRE